SRSSRFLAQTTTLYPSLAKAKETALPIPFVAPVINAVFIIFLFSSQLLKLKLQILKHYIYANISLFMLFTYFGKYLILLTHVSTKPEQWSIYWIEIILDLTHIGVGSLSLVRLISTFSGPVMAMQIAVQLVSDLIPASIIGQINRDSSIHELS